MGISVRIACDVKDRAALDDMVEIQRDLKVMSDDDYKRLKGEILDSGFAFPVLVWKDSKSDKKLKIVGGHQRIRALRRMREEGIAVPPVPYVSVHAKNIAEAKRRVLQDVSQYGKLAPSGLFQFMQEAEFTFDVVNMAFSLPDFDIEDFKAAYFPNETDVSFKAKDGATELSEGEFSKFDHLCPKCGFSFDDKK